MTDYDGPVLRMHVTVPNPKVEDDTLNEVECGVAAM
jgi:hypothetical protein